jgi:hypothetical protein
LTLFGLAETIESIAMLNTHIGKPHQWQLVWGADPRYNEDLLSEGLRSMTSKGPNADALEDPEYEDLHFDELSGLMEIPELHVPEPIFSFVPYTNYPR